METRNFCAASVPVQKLNGSTSQKKVIFSIRVSALTTPCVSYYEAPKIGMKYHHNTALFMIRCLRDSNCGPLKDCFELDLIFLDLLCIVPVILTRTRDTRTVIWLPTSVLQITSERASAPTRLNQRQCQCSVRRVCEKSASMENSKDQSHETQDPALNGECYLHASARSGTIVRAATSQKAERFRTNFCVFRQA
jgi:hypothetical protein